MSSTSVHQNDRCNFALADILPAASDSATSSIHVFLIDLEFRLGVAATALLLQNLTISMIASDSVLLFCPVFKVCLHNNKSPSVLQKW